MKTPFPLSGPAAVLLLCAAAMACGGTKKGVATGPDCGGQADHTGASQPFHTVPIDNGNDFNGAREGFRTSTQAQSGYRAYATWDPCALYLGMTGSAIGSGDCDDASGGTCAVPDLPESPHRHVVFYLDTDPTGDRGTRDAKEYGGQRWRLPFAADRLVTIRTDGVSRPRGDSIVYTGNARVWESGEGGWTPMEEQPMKVGDNSSSNFLELELPLKALGEPCAIRVVGWVIDERRDTAFAYWPAEADPSSSARSGGGPASDSAGGASGSSASSSSASSDSAGSSSGRSSSSSSMDSASSGSSSAGARGRASGSSSGSSGGSSGSGRGSSSNSASSSSSYGQGGGSSSGSQASSRGSGGSAGSDSASRSSGGDSTSGRGRSFGPPSSSASGAGKQHELKHFWGFQLVDGTAPNVSANLDRTVFDRAEGCREGGS